MQIILQTLVMGYLKNFLSAKVKNMKNPVCIIIATCVALINLTIFEILLSSSINKLLIVEYSFSEIKAGFVASLVFLLQFVLIIIGMCCWKKKTVDNLTSAEHPVRKIIASFIEGFQHR